MKHFLDKLAEVLLQPVSKVVSFLMAAYTALWGLWVAVPWTDVFERADLYSALFEFIPSEALWGILAIVFATVSLLGINAKYKREEFWGAALISIFWFIISVFYFIGDIANTGGITAAFLSLLALYVYLNCKINYVKDQKDE